MNKIWRLCFAVTAFVVLGLFGFQVDAEEYTQSFMGRWTDEEMYTDEDIEVLPTDDDLFGGKLYVLNYNGDSKRTGGEGVWVFAGSLPDADSSVKFTKTDGTTELSTYDLYEDANNPDVTDCYIPDLPENYFAVWLNEFDSTGDCCYLFITDGNNHTEQYTFLINGQDKVSKSYKKSYPYRYAKNIDLVDAARDNEVIEPLVKTEDWTAEDSPSVCRKITLPEGKKEVALRFSREEADEEEDLKVPDTCVSGSKMEWLDCTRRLVRVNGGAKIYCTDATKERDRVSPNLELKRGWNVVQISQLSGSWPTIYEGGFVDWLENESAVMTFLVYSGEDTLSEKNSNTAISSITAYAGPKEKDNPLPACEVGMEETGEDAYRLVMPSGRSCNQIMVRVDLEAPGASWNFVDEAGTDIGVGYIGDWGAFNASGRDKVYIKVTASDETTQTTPVYLVDDGKSKEAECTAMEITGGSEQRLHQGDGGLYHQASGQDVGSHI